jgi:CheY-like chemotaxis protein
VPKSLPWKIVLIDDEEDIRDVMSMALADAGYEVATAENGIAGLKLCQEFLPQIVITDIRMPGMDGLQVLAEIKNKFSDVEVIVATAFGEMEPPANSLPITPRCSKKNMPKPASNWSKPSNFKKTSLKAPWTGFSPVTATARL